MDFAIVPLWVPLLVAAPFVGSFLGTLIQRLPARRPVLLARSQCDSCKAALGAADLVPLASWLVLRGKCRHCGAAIGAFPLAIELAAMAVAVWAATETTGIVLVATCILGWLLLALAVTDLRTFILPDALNAALALSGLLATWTIDPDGLPDSAIGMAVGFAAFALISYTYRRLRRRDGLGLGDAKLLGALGAWVSWQGLPSVVLHAAVAGLVAALALSLSGRALTAATRFPFGAFLALAGWIVWLYAPVMFGI